MSHCYPTVPHVKCFYRYISRFQELCKVPRLVVEGISSEDLNEGELGNQWFVAAASGLAQNNLLWKKVSRNCLVSKEGL